jgi:heat shock protein HslJ
MNIRNFFVGRAIGFIILLVVVGIVAAFYSLNNYIYEEKQAVAVDDYKDAEYVIEGTRVKLVDGLSEVEIAPGSASKVVTRYFGNRVVTDLNNDGREDIVFLLTEESGGSGVFFYVVAALNTERGYVGSEAYLLGDRIAPQTTEKRDDGVVVVNFAVRAPGEPFSASPSVGKSVYLKFDVSAMEFEKVVDDNQPQLSLTSKTWTWVSALYNDGREIRPNDPSAFTLTLMGGKFSATTDCNRMGGIYTLNQSEISFSDIFSTKMYCSGSQESDFAKLLESAQIYHFTSNGELVFDLKFDSGTVTFK